MKTFLAVVGSVLTSVSSLCGAEFVKGDRVELLKETPIYFKDVVLRIGNSGEQFTVILHKLDTHRVYLSAQDAVGKEIAVSVSDTQLQKAGLQKAQQMPRKELREAKPEEAVFLAKTATGSGTAFLAQMNGFCYIVTNAHVVAAASKIEFKNSTTLFTISAGDVEIANDRDLVRFPSQSDFGLLLANEVKADESAFAYGNSGGEGVVTKLPGNVLGVGVEKVEVSCEFIPGNSGGPILNEQGRVIAVASYLTGNADADQWIKAGTRFEKARRFGFRPSDEVKWTRIPFAQFVSESKQIEEVTAMSDFFVLVANQLLFHSFNTEIENRFPKNENLANFITSYNRGVTSLNSKVGAFATQRETQQSNSKLKGSARTLTAELVRIIDAAALDFKLKGQRIKTPYFRKQGDDLLAELRNESQLVNKNAKEAFGSDFLK